MKGSSAGRRFSDFMRSRAAMTSLTEAVDSLVSPSLKRANERLSVNAKAAPDWLSSVSGRNSLNNARASEVRFDSMSTLAVELHCARHLSLASSQPSFPMFERYSEAILFPKSAAADLRRVSAHPFASWDSSPSLSESAPAGSAGPRFKISKHPWSGS